MGGNSKNSNPKFTRERQIFHYTFLFDAYDTPKDSKGGTTVNIEKLADTVVIEKEADVDKVVEDMVKKFRKLVPNMP